MSIEFYITIDTEPDCDVKWRRSNPLTFSSVTYGIPRLLRPIWDKYEIKPLYFVSPEVLRDEESCTVLKNEVKKGALIGTHLHSEYVEPGCTISNPAGLASNEFPCYAHSKEIEYEKIKNLTGMIKERLDYEPVWYRAARYGADIDTIRILKDLGYLYDSSVTPFIDWRSKGGPDHSQAPLQPYYVSSTNLYVESSREDGTGIKEYPITIKGKRFGLLQYALPESWLFYNWLRPSHMSVIEQKLLVNQMVKKFKDPVLVMMFHSMEVMVGKTPFVKSRLMQHRFLKNLEKVIEYIGKK